MAHFKKLFNTNYLGYWDLDKPKEYVIKGIRRDEVFIPNANIKEQKVIIELENEKPFVCNVTNAKIISEQIQSSDVNDWIGQKIILFSSLDRFGRDVVECVRVMTANDKSKYKLMVEVKKITKDLNEQMKISKMSVERIKNYIDANKK